MIGKETIVAILFLFIGLFFGRYFSSPIKMHGNMNMEEMRDHFVLQKSDMQKQMLAGGDYKCCLENPCTYCIEKTPGHGEGASCSCLEDIMNGRHPCGECIGEILEGHGNKFIAKYFAVALAEELGEEHIDTIRQIISQKYEISIENQI